MNEGFESALSGDDFDQLLQRLAEEAQQHPPQSPQRQRALQKLISEILQSNRLRHPQRDSWLLNLYEDLYNEALQKTLLEICQKIDHYNSEHRVMAWVNFLLKNRFIDVVNDYKKQGITYIPKSEKEQITCFLFLDDLEQCIPVEDTRFDDELLRQFLEDDPENLLKNERLRNNSEVTFQYLALAKFVEDKTWTEIAAKLGISVQTLCSFFNRRLQKLMPYFKKYL
jgi:DNA-directed RNA polymerase specialized sigma24 family protein